ncbi:MAG TPA: hypothetical protein DCW95_05305 [Chryseobacterium sp.]|nr:hypothetical protein [Chryseobacterium sp.]
MGSYFPKVYTIYFKIRGCIVAVITIPPDFDFIDYGQRDNKSFAWDNALLFSPLSVCGDLTNAY